VATKDRISITLDPGLIARVDRLAELRECSRSAAIEMMLERAVEEDEKLFGSLENPVLGAIVQSILDHPKIVASIASLVGQGITPDELERWKTAGPTARRARQLMRQEKGRRTDLSGEGA
jgi:hypothetical protein